MSKLAALTQLPADVAETLQLLQQLDSCFASGFARLSTEQHTLLNSLPGLFHASPLGEPLQKAILELERSMFLPAHFVSLAVARAALLGAVHDALLVSAAEVLGRPLEAGGVVQRVGPAAPAVQGRQEAVLQWLTEVALAGFARLDVAVVHAIESTLSSLREVPEMFRLASLVVGFTEELRVNLPISDPDALPLSRWVDLWSRAVLLCTGLPPAEVATPSTGVLHPIGVELRAHRHALSLCVYGLYEADGTWRSVRSTASAWKVDVLSGPDLWQLLRAKHANLLQAVATPARLELTGSLSASGDLRRGEEKVGAAIDPFNLPLVPGACQVPISRVQPFDRHPAQLAIPIRLEGKVSGQEGALQMAGLSVLPVGDINADILRKTEGLVGLLRFDAGRWFIQPLVAKTTGKGGGLIHHASGAATKVKVDRVAILKERAGKLLRVKS